MTLPKNEYPNYAQSYVDAAIKTEKNILENLQYSLSLVFETLGDLSKNKYDYAYAKDKWTIKELVQHLIDSERIFAYRALRISRDDTQNLLGFDETDFMTNFNLNDASMINLLKEFSLVRKSNIAMFKGFSNQMLQKIGEASNQPISVRALGVLMSGHVIHHINVIKERYL
jgi:hypothetical protein